MSDRVWDKAWSNIQPGDTIRWATPRFIKYGRVVNRGGNSMSVQFVGETSVRAIPEAKWYFVEGKRDPQAEEHLVILHPSTGLDIPTFERLPRDHPLSGEASWVSVQQACEILRMDQKQMRRHIRRGTIPATKKDDRWVIDRETLLGVAGKAGWL